MTTTSPPNAAADGIADVVDTLRTEFRRRPAHDVSWRRSQLDGLERFLDAEHAALAEALAGDLGRSEFESALSDLGSVRTEISDARRNLTKWTRRQNAKLPLLHRPGKAFYMYEPLGVVLVIGPWNYPVYLTLGPLVGAIAAGCSAVVKPSEHAPRTSAVLAERLSKYLDPSSFVVTEGGADVTQDLLAQGFDHVFFTGGGEIGRRIMIAAAQTLTPVTLELGGKSPVVIAADTDMRSAGRRIAFTKTANSGQTCVAPDYVLVEESVAGTFVESVQHWMREFTLDTSTASGVRIVNEGHTKRLGRLLDSHGGRVVMGGKADVGAKCVEPTIIVDPDLESALMQEEIFGPVLPVITVESTDDAIDFIARRPHPLAAYLFSDRPEVQDRFINGVHAGGLVINHLVVHVGVPTLPFGGVGPSGTGAYHGKFGFETFSHRKSVLKKPIRPDPSLIYPPYSKAKLALLRRLIR